MGPAAASEILHVMIPVDAYLQRTVGYPVRKPLAKYIDEYNWWRAWGLGTPTTENAEARDGETPA
jgi:hypothetical protein